MSRTRLIIAAVAAALAASAHAAGDPAAGKHKNFQCNGCHGIPGWKTAFPEVYHVPKLGGQNAAYIVAALKEYKKGDRDLRDDARHRLRALRAGHGRPRRVLLAGRRRRDRRRKMRRAMNKHTLVALLVLALSGPAFAAKGDPEAGKAKSEPCKACHGEAGISVSPDFPKLAGQHSDYLATALKHYKLGKRKNPIMVGQVANLSETDMLDLAAYFSSQPGLATKY